MNASSHAYALSLPAQNLSRPGRVMQRRLQGRFGTIQHGRLLFGHAIFDDSLGEDMAGLHAINLVLVCFASFGNGSFKQLSRYALL